jgi:hypothetical protein
MTVRRSRPDVVIGLDVILDVPSLHGIAPRRFLGGPWARHIAFGHDVVAETAPKLLVELGTFLGESYFTFCQAVKERATGTTCFAIDTWRGDVHNGFNDESVYAAVAGHNDQHYSSFSYLVRTTFDDARAQFADESIDLLHIDGLHTYEAVRHDYESWLPKVRPGGLILFHDIVARTPTFGAWKLWEEIAHPPSSFTFRFGNGLGVLRKQPGADGCALLDALFSGDERVRRFLHDYYELAGAKIWHEMKGREAAEELQRVVSSPSWRITRPLRAAAARARRLLRGGR